MTYPPRSGMENWNGHWEKMEIRLNDYKVSNELKQLTQQHKHKRRKMGLRKTMSTDNK